MPKKAAAPSSTFTVEQWPVEKVTPYENNARVIPQSAVDKVAESIKAVGWRQVIVVDKDGVIIAGHTRLQAAKKLGLTTVPVHVAANLTPAQVRAYRIADNRSAEESKWDKGKLKDELVKIVDDSDADRALVAMVTGFDAKELDALIDVKPETPDEPPPERGRTKMVHTCPKCGHEWHGSENGSKRQSMFGDVDE